MKKTYMVKKNPNLPYSADNWIFMNSYEFAMFMKTEDGQKRKKNFAQIDACGEDDDIIVVECGEERAKEWRAEKDAHDYLKECEAESGIETVSFCAINDDGEEINLDEFVADPDADIIADIVRNEEFAKLRYAIKQLTLNEQAFIRTMFGAKELKSERQVAVIYGVSCVAIHKRKIKIFEKIKTFL